MAYDAPEPGGAAVVCAGDPAGRMLVTDSAGPAGVHHMHPLCLRVEGLSRAARPLLAGRGWILACWHRAPEGGFERPASRGPLAALVVALAIQAPSAVAQDRPLPDLHEFLPKVRAHLHTDQRLQSQYAYLEHRTELHLSPLGRPTNGPASVYEVYPGNELIPTYRRLIETDGKPTPTADLDRADRDHRRKVIAAVEKRQHESASDREKRLNRMAKDRAHEEQVFDDLMRAYDFTLIGRQTIDGRPAIVFDFSPSARAKVLTDDGKLMLKLKGRAWASEDDYELARVEVEMLDDLSIFLGLAGKLYRGGTASLERRKLNGEVWLPAEATFHGAGRAFIRHFRVDTTIRYSDYRKYAVETDTTFALPGER
jgi:hypothetical protein